MEIWKEVYGYDVLFEVSNQGRARTKYKKGFGYTSEYSLMTACDNGNGYLRFNLKRDGKQKTAYLHRLVAVAFVENRNGYNEINHKDENKKNNAADNLEWVSHVKNCNYGTRNIRSGQKLCRAVVCVESNARYNSLREAAESMGVVSTAISNCLNGRAETCCGYHWRYNDVE